MKKLKSNKLPVMGAVQGSVTVPEHLLAAATQLANELYENGVANEFSGEEVPWLNDETLMPQCTPLFPHEAVHALGYVPAALKQARVYGTAGVAAHVDNEGIIFIMVLANQGLRFKQKGQINSAGPGEWFLFDDRVPHEVRESKNSRGYVFLHVPLQKAEN